MAWSSIFFPSSSLVPSTLSFCFGRRPHVVVVFAVVVRRGAPSVLCLLSCMPSCTLHGLVVAGQGVVRRCEPPLVLSLCTPGLCGTLFRGPPPPLRCPCNRERGSCGFAGPDASVAEQLTNAFSVPGGIAAGRWNFKSRVGKVEVPRNALELGNCRGAMDRYFFGRHGRQRELKEVNVFGYFITEQA